ncbi:unnamed protein product [Ambrosiozyma monospora]|uniref:Unnamed protein product n=1 Tax=Ambrosiozyma monospora TaxID=43982 RepID=A0A9W6YYC1_AMBMO|nr:unnamed protein product [Ambrosiozyma monospora]
MSGKLKTTRVANYPNTSIFNDVRMTGMLIGISKPSNNRKPYLFHIIDFSKKNPARHFNPTKYIKPGDRYITDRIIEDYLFDVSVFDSEFHQFNIIFKRETGTDLTEFTIEPNGYTPPHHPLIYNNCWFISCAIRGTAHNDIVASNRGRGETFTVEPHREIKLLSFKMARQDPDVMWIYRMDSGMMPLMADMVKVFDKEFFVKWKSNLKVTVPTAALNSIDSFFDDDHVCADQSRDGSRHDRDSFNNSGDDNGVLPKVEAGSEHDLSALREQLQSEEQHGYQLNKDINEACSLDSQNYNPVENREYEENRVGKKPWRNPAMTLTAAIDGTSTPNYSPTQPMASSSYTNQILQQAALRESTATASSLLKRPIRPTIASQYMDVSNEVSSSDEESMDSSSHLLEHGSHRHKKHKPSNSQYSSMDPNTTYLPNYNTLADLHKVPPNMIARSYYVNVKFVKLRNNDGNTVRKLCRKLYDKLKSTKFQSSLTVDEASGNLIIINDNNDGPLPDSSSQEEPEKSAEFYETGLEFTVADKYGSKLDLIVTVNDAVRFLGLADFDFDFGSFGSNGTDVVDKLVERVNRRVTHFLTSEKYIGVLVRKLHRGTTGGDDTTTNTNTTIESIWQWVYTDVWYY